jgi:5-methyltetrahydropteroyltriglutamate--homocysteine methyltransferase
MYATLVGAYPRTSHPGQPFRLRAAYGQLERAELDEVGFRGVQDELVRQVVEEQIDAGLGLLTDGQVRWEDPQTAIARGLDGFEITGLLRYFDTNTYYRQPRATAQPTWRGPILVEDWRFAASAAAELAAARGIEPLPVKAALVGPYTLARLADPGSIGRDQLTLSLAEALNREIRALFEAGAPLVQVDENALTLIGPDDDAERRLAADAFARLTDGLGARHLSLAVTMGNAEHAGASLFYDAPFSSYLFDLIAGPDSWRVIAQAPTDRGIVAGVADARNTRRDDEAVMIWAGRYAAALNGRGLDRVGLAPSTGLEYLPRDRAKAKIEALAEAARKAGIADPEAFKREVDPRMLDAKSAAFGRYMPRTAVPVGDPLAGVAAGEGGTS